MNSKLFISVFLCILLINSSNAQNSINTELLNELEKMGEIDQLAAANAFPTEEYKYLSQDQWNAKKDSIFRANQHRIEEVLEEFGFPGYDLVGKRGSELFWMITQHADFNPKFQKKVLDAMYPEVQKKNANPRNYAYLTDRVNLNLGEKQVYGTQLTYNIFTGTASSRPTIDPKNLNKRRKDAELEPIEEYLADNTKSHMEFNEAFLGITKVGVIIITAGLILCAIGSFVIIRLTRIFH